ncbi:threonine-phosphate decarboxylase [Pleurocapsales cyanobacterium LEGE 06147]|nr:threonine-phosphate decarboxylase [Pleurocapsales cyanobacterium LEGE 06147]
MTRPKHGGNLAWAAAIAGCPASFIRDFSASINPLGPPQRVLNAIEQGLQQLKSYPDPDYFELRSSLAQYHQLETNYILPGNGSAELLTWASRELAQQKVTYLITPAFGDYWRALKAFNTNIFPHSLIPVSPRLCTDISSAGNKFPRRVLVPASPHFPIPLSSLLPDKPPDNSGLLLNNPHNPTGMLWTRAEILPYLEKFALVVVDEAFMDFLPPHQEQSLISLITDFSNLVILRSLTKFYSLPGLRIGYAIAHPKRLQRWQQWRDPWSVNILAALAAEAAIQDREFQQQTWDWLPSARAKLIQGLASIPGLKPLEGAANFLLVPTKMSGQQLQQTLLRQYHILIRDCLSFPELGDRYFRIAVRSPEENQQLIEAMEQAIFQES